MAREIRDSTRDRNDRVSHQCEEIFTGDLYNIDEVHLLYIYVISEEKEKSFTIQKYIHPYSQI